MSYGRTKIVVNAGGMTRAQADLILKLADQKAWDLHPSEKMREWYAMHLADIENNPATSPLTGGWHGTASTFINSLQKLPDRNSVEKKQEQVGEILDLLDGDPWSGPIVDDNKAEMELADKDNSEKKLVGPGVYNFEGMMFAVKESRQNPGKHYAYSIRLVNNKFKHEYAKGVIFKLTDEMRVSADAVVALNLSTIHEHNGKRVGSCCVCGRMLTKKASIEAGIGPICAGKVGL